MKPADDGRCPANAITCANSSADSDSTEKFVTYDGILGKHTAIRRVRELIAQVASTSATVLITGETGTGKGLVAAALHAKSERNGRPFIKLTCASLAESILESELFGHERGAFTGALSRREGHFMRAHRGTLLLDEISEIPLSTQTKLLRFLQEREFERVGGNETIGVDVRLIAASNRDVYTLVKAGSFREDLYYRLNIVHIATPPLRAHMSDIGLLANDILIQLSKRHGRRIEGFDPEAFKMLMSYDWPGNVRELENVIERAVVTTNESWIRPEKMMVGHDAVRCPDPFEMATSGRTFSEIERAAILNTLKSVEGSTAKAAEILGISLRRIQYRLRQYREAGFLPAD